MANNSRQVSNKSKKLNQPRVGKIQMLTKSSKKHHRGSWIWSFLSLLILLGSAGLIIGFGWLSILFILNPERVVWLNKFLPAWIQVPVSKGLKPQTLREIQISLSGQKYLAGEILPLDGEVKNSFLLPIFRNRANCQVNCEELIELRVYQRSQEKWLESQPDVYYDLMSQLLVVGLAESFVEGRVETENQDVKVYLPLTEIGTFTNPKLAPGKWFYLQGKLAQGNKAIAYGQIIHYDPNNNTIRQVLPWKNLHGTLPQWQQVTGNSTLELVLDQTIGLEPNIQVYQIKSSQINHNLIQLAAIQLQNPALNDPEYQKALLLARNGLWTPAFSWLKSLHKRRKFSPTAHAQFNLIRLHSQFTQSQAAKKWASPSQQVLTDLIDGRWEKALQVFTTSPESSQEIANLLKSDRGRLWKRANAALRVNPQRKEVLAWVLLIIAAQRGENRANSWLKQQPNVNPQTYTELQDLLKILKGEVTEKSLLPPHPSQIIGTVKQLNPNNLLSQNSQWLPLDTEIDFYSPNHQTWYEVEVSTFYNGKTWLNYPFTQIKPPKTQTSKFFRQILGIDSDPNLQIVFWHGQSEQQTTTARIKAVKLQDSKLSLLAASSQLDANNTNYSQSKPLALTEAALNWVQPSYITVSQFSQQTPEVAQIILPSVWQVSQKSSNIPDFEELQTQMGEWPVQLVDITNDGEMEIVLTMAVTDIANLGQQTSVNTEDQNLAKTIIFRRDGKIIYNDFQANSQQRMRAIAQLTENQPLALLVETTDKYSLKRWSQSRQRFE
ncbi:MAG TPA: hypothetical protein VK184_07720 [Nostocaceae cyanobacterium]|nr:hypothetical protein [Nostocaceae cyanobacterium]